MESIFAVQGYYVACCTKSAGPGRFVGYAKICVDRPATYATADFVEKLASVGMYDDEDRALKAAEFQARQVVQGLKPNWAPFTAPGR